MTNPDLRLPNNVSDPTHTFTLRIGYQKSIKNLYTDFKKKIMPVLEKMNFRAGILRDITDKLDIAADNSIYADAPDVIHKNINLSYQAGKRKAGSNPRIARSKLTIPYAINYLDQMVIEDLKARNFSLVVGATEDMKANMLRVMSEGIQQNKGTLAIARNMSREIASISKKRAVLIARTEIAHSYNTAIAKSYEKAGISKWQWLAAMGERTCEECARRHGEVYEWGAEQPPLHPRCLCTIYPVVDREFRR